MSKQKIPKVTVPLVSYIQPGTSEPIKTKRLRPEDALDIALLIKELEASTIVTKMIKDNPWSIISVFSPYSIDFHVMLMETGMRYIPSPEYVEDNEVEDLMSLWIKIIQFMKKRDKDQRIFIGYNWSPRSWGELEETGGFQSIPTKWHPMFWSWPVFNDDNKSKYFTWEERKDLKIPFNRMNGENNFVAPIAERIKDKADELIKKSFGEDIIIKGTSISNNYGFSVTFKESLENLLNVKFFNDFLKPLSSFLDDFFAGLTEIFLNGYQSSEINVILKKTSNGKLSDEDIEEIRKFSPLKDEKDIKKSLEQLFSSLKNEEYSTPEAIKELIEIVRNREKYAKCFDKIKNELQNEFDFDKKAMNELLSEIGNRCKDKLKLPAWRKGFAYALVFEELKENNKEVTRLKIVPAAYLGNGGIVEATGVVLKRLENADAKLPIEQCRIKSIELFPLKKIINGKNENEIFY